VAPSNSLSGVDFAIDRPTSRWLSWKAAHRFKSEFIRDFDCSYDGKQLATIRGHRESDVVLIHDSEK
jgi:hypothetical protein